MKNKNRITASKIMALIEKQQFKCALTGRDLTPASASIDHINPLSRGGAHDLSNVWIIDGRVNSAKGTMTSEEFIAMCREVADHFRASS